MSHTVDPRQAFIEMLTPIIGLRADAQNHLYDLLMVRQFAKNGMLIVDGHPADRIHFVHSGLARGYYLDEREREVNMWFVDKGDFIPLPYSMPNQQPTLETVDFLEKTVIVWISQADLQSLYDNYPETASLESLLLSHHLTKYVEWMRAFRLYRGEDRYNWFLERYPNFKMRLAMKHIASFLNLSAEAISRFRGKKKS